MCLVQSVATGPMTVRLLCNRYVASLAHPSSRADRHAHVLLAPDGQSRGRSAGQELLDPAEELLAFGEEAEHVAPVEYL
jgi:hypothetical protein